MGGGGEWGALGGLKRKRFGETPQKGEHYYFSQRF